VCDRNGKTTFKYYDLKVVVSERLGILKDYSGHKRGTINYIKLSNGFTYHMVEDWIELFFNGVLQTDFLSKYAFKNIQMFYQYETK